MQDRQQSDPVRGINAEGEEREYKFWLMDAENGTRLFHEYAGVLTGVHDTFVDFLVDLAKRSGKELSKEQEEAYTILGTDESIIMVIKRLPEIFTWPVMSGLARDLLCNHTVVIDGKEYTANERGFTGYVGDPLEMYCAMLYAVEANYPKYIKPLKNRLALLFGNDSTQESSQQQKSEAPEK
jgi:hypothetical protein